MELLVVAGILVAAVLTPLLWIKHRTQKERGTANWLVLRSIDDRILWTGVLAGAAISCIGLTAKALAPPLMWTWASTSWRPFGGEDPNLFELFLLAVVVVATVSLPSIMVLVLPQLFLLISMALTVRRHELGNPPRPFNTFLIISVLWIVITYPLINAIAYGLMSAMVSAALRRDTVPTMEPGHPETVEQRGIYDTPLWTVWSRDKDTTEMARAFLSEQWQQLSPASRYHLARVCGIHVVVVITAYVIDMAAALLAVSAS